MIYAFADFELDEQLFELRYRGEPVPIQARVWKTIAYLVQQRARVVDKAELLEAVWAGTAVSEAAISQVIMLARKALGDDTGQQRIIKTVRSRGFRFVATVQAKVSGTPGSLAPAVQTIQAQAGHSSALSKAPSTALIGRDDELASLDQRLAEAQGGCGGLLLIEGEPGIGKSALVQELGKRAQAQGVLVLWGKAWEEGGAPPFWPWVQVLRGLLLAGDLSRVEMIDGDHARRQIANLGKRARFLGSDHALLLGLGDPIVIVVTMHFALANGAF